VIIKFLSNEGADSRQIAVRLRTQFHEDAYALCTVQFWMTEWRRGREDLPDEPRTGRSSAENLPTRIQEISDENPFEPARAMAEILQVSDFTVLKHLHEDLQLQSFHLHWVPHMLTPELREQLRASARGMIPILAAVAHDGWHHLVTGDESWFFLSYSPRRMWTLSRDDVATKPKHDICTQKFMFTMIWNPRRFQVVDKLPTATKMNSGYFITNILELLEQKIFLN
jgi:hypothetical protein